MRSISICIRVGSATLPTLIRRAGVAPLVIVIMAAFASEFSQSRSSNRQSTFDGIRRWALRGAVHSGRE